MGLKGLMYEIGTKSRSAKVHRFLLGTSSFAVRPVNLDSEFDFECAKTGGCCRGRSDPSNHIVGEKQLLRIKAYCEERNRPIRGWYQVPNLHLELDGYERTGVILAKVPIQGAKGVAYVARQRDCQFLDGDLCGIHPVKPLICKLAPVGMLVEHTDTGGRLLLAIQCKPECPDCFSGRRWTVREWIVEQLKGRVNEFNDQINAWRVEAGWPTLPLPKVDE